MRLLTSHINRPTQAPSRGWDFTATVCLAFSAIFLFLFEFRFPFPLMFDSLRQSNPNKELGGEGAVGRD
jgi:hypothetical protein